MNRMILALITAALVASTTMAGASPQTDTPTNKRAAAAQWSEDGLQQIKVKGLDLVYSRPGASLSVYKKVLINPVSVAFRREQELSPAILIGTRIPGRIRPEDTQRIKDDLAQIVREEVLRELGKGGYQLVDTAGEDVLELNLRVAELYLNAPNLPTADFIRTYTRSFGEMTLLAELRDATTGDVVMRILDRSIGRDFGEFRRTTRVENAVDLRIAANAWARALRRELDLTKGTGGQL